MWQVCHTGTYWHINMWQSVTYLWNHTAVKAVGLHCLFNSYTLKCFSVLLRQTAQSQTHRTLSHLWTSTFKSHRRFSIGSRPGLWLVHSNTNILWKDVSPSGFSHWPPVQCNAPFSGERGTFMYHHIKPATKSLNVLLPCVTWKPESLPVFKMNFSHYISLSSFWNCCN